MKKNFLLLLFLLLFSCYSTNKKEINDVFLPNIVSSNISERDITISDKYKELYFTSMCNGICFICKCIKENNHWNNPKIAKFSGNRNYLDVEACLSHSGDSLFFMSTRAPKNMEQKSGWYYQNIWLCTRTKNNKWSKPQMLPKIINSGKGEYYPSISKKGNFYFTREYDTNKRGIFVSKCINGKFSKPIMLPKEINANNNIYNGYISPNEDFMVVCSRIKDNCIGRSDYYISFNKGNGKWTPIINMGKKINNKGSYANSMYITENGKTLLFSGIKISDEFKKNPSNINEIRNYYKEAKNGNMDILKEDASILDSLKKVALNQ